MITGNKGEWSEIYALFKLLGDKQLFLGDKDIEKLEGLVYPIIKILRSEKHNNFEYSIDDEIVIISGDGESTLNIPIRDFKEKALLLLSVIKSKKERTFAIPEIERFMNSVNCNSLKAGSSVKTDITIVVHDQRTNQQPTLGFSIKSQLGSPSTLLNAGKTTNFIYRIEGEMKSSEIERINSLNVKRGSKESADIKGRLNAILENGCNLVFYQTEKSIFSNNLVLIDSLMPEILAQIVLSFYSGESPRLSNLVSKISEHNPLKFDTRNEHKFYDYKIKKFLTDVALGMMPSTVWSGKYDATGGYLIVKNDGDVLCYHIYNRNQFEDYLLNNTKLETASSSRHDFGEIYVENRNLLIKLNLQIRFLK